MVVNNSLILSTQFKTNYLEEYKLEKVSLDEVVFSKNNDTFVLKPEYDSEMQEVLSEEEGCDINSDDLRCNYIYINNFIVYLDTLVGIIE